MSNAQEAALSKSISHVNISKYRTCSREGVKVLNCRHGAQAVGICTSLRPRSVYLTVRCAPADVVMPSGQVVPLTRSYTPLQLTLDRLAPAVATYAVDAKPMTVLNRAPSAPSTGGSGGGANKRSLAEIQVCAEHNDKPSAGEGKAFWRGPRTAGSKPLIFALTKHALWASCKESRYVAPDATPCNSVWLKG